jgi:hypothetical protein
MFRLPQGVTWLMVAGVVGVIFGGMWVGSKVSERNRLLANLERHAKAYPTDADVAGVLIACNKKLIVRVDDCGSQLIQRFGTDVVTKVAVMQMRGAFGMPLGPDGKPLPLPDPTMLQEAPAVQAASTPTEAASVPRK